MHHAMMIFVAAAGTASALGSPVERVGPFDSLTIEGFDGGGWSFETDPRDIMGGIAQVAPGDGAGWTHITNRWGLHGAFEASTYSGSGMLGNTTGSIVYTFDSAFTRFGGYFATIATTPDATASFFRGGALVARGALEAPVGAEWTWNGWSVSGGFTRVEINPNHNEGRGGFLMHDAVRVDSAPVPSPGALALLGLSGMLVIGRRRVR